MEVIATVEAHIPEIKPVELAAVPYLDIKVLFVVVFA